MKNVVLRRDALPAADSLFACPAIERREDSCFASPISVYPPACKLFIQGLAPQHVFCIHSGLVKLVNVTADGKESLLAVRSAGWILGVASLILAKPYRATAETLTSCELHHCSAQGFRDLAERDIKFARQLLQLVSQGLYDQTDQLVLLRTLTARQRIENLLMQVTGSDNGGRVELPLRLEEIAQWIAVAPAHLSRLLKQMEKDGAIKREKGWIFVTGLRPKV